jgi:hypothetical protein
MPHLRRIKAVEKLSLNIKFFGRFSLCVVLSIFFFLGCASRLPRERHVHPPVFDGDSVSAKVDLDSVIFKELKTRRLVSLGAFMREAGVDSVLLTFGSKSCAACNRKAQSFTADIIGKHPIYLTDSGRKFMIVGVNTDPSPERLGAYLTDYPFISLSDPGGEVMVSRFAPPGSRFRVPLAVMIHRSHIAWRVLPDDHTSVSGMMRQVAMTLGLGDVGVATETPPSGRDDTQRPDAGDITVPPSGSPLLGSRHPGRLDGQELWGCDDEKTSLSESLASGDWRFVQIARGSCQGACLENLGSLKDLTLACQSGGLSACRGVTLEAEHGSDSVSRAGCAAAGSKGIFKGGDDFFQVFASHFDWRYPRDLDSSGLPYLTHGVRGPLVLGFAKDGTLIFSREGVVRTEELVHAVRERDPSHHARGPDFPLFSQAKGAFGFADWRLAAEYTVVMGWSTICTSCDAQLKHWSEPGQLVDFCASHDGFCQVGAVENAFPGIPLGLEEYFQRLLHGIYDDAGRTSYDGFEKLGIRVPLLLDPVADGPGPFDYLNRLHDGYMLAASRGVPSEHMNDFRTFIYDKEGKIVGKFYGEVLESGKDDPVLTRLKQLLSEERSQKGGRG